MIACLASEEQGFMLTIAGTGRNVSFSPDSMVHALWIRTKIIVKIHLPAFLCVMVSTIVQK